jgi:hypothetical protein
MKFTATLEYLAGQHASITLLDEAGEQAGVCRLEMPGDPLADHDVGYGIASTMAVIKGGILDQFSMRFSTGKEN